MKRVGPLVVFWVLIFSGVGGNGAAVAERVVVDEPGLIVVAFDAEEGGGYDLRGIGLYVEAALDAFPVGSHPGAGALADVYEVVQESPTLENGAALEEAFQVFAAGLGEADEARMQGAVMEAMEAGMRVMRFELMRHLAVGFGEEFSTDDYPALGEFYDAVEGFSNRQSELTADRAETALRKFGKSLVGADRKQAEAIEKAASQELAQEYSGATIQAMISGWVDQIEQSHEYLRGDKGGVVSAEAFDLLEGEMGYDAVRGIVGREGDRTVSGSSNVDGVVTTSAQYLWSWDLESGRVARIHAYFLNDELRVKAYDEVAD